jgi:U-box domain
VGNGCNFLHSTAVADDQQTSTDTAQVEPPEEYMCSISAELMVDPVNSSSGYIYERAAMEAWLNESGTDPYSRELMTSAELRPVRGLKDLIEK